MDLETLFAVSPIVVALVPVTLGLVGVVGTVFGLKSKFLPLLSIAFGIGLVALTTQVWQVVVAQGIIVGLSASGLFDFGKKTVFGKE
jgi:hypothetical protein